MNKGIEGKVINVIRNALDLPEERIELEGRFIEDYGGDSLDAVEIAMELEEIYNIEISDKELENCDTVNDLIKCVEKKVNERESTGNQN